MVVLGWLMKTRVCVWPYFRLCVWLENACVRDSTFACVDDPNTVIAVQTVQTTGTRDLAHGAAEGLWPKHQKIAEEIAGLAVESATTQVERQ